MVFTYKMWPLEMEFRKVYLPLEMQSIPRNELYVHHSRHHDTTENK